MSKIKKALGMEDAPSDAVMLAKIMAVLMSSYSMAFAISSTFWLVFIAETLGGGNYVAGLAIVGILVIIQLTIQTVFDYPTGALGDHIGQKYVIASALLCYAFAFLLTSTIVETSSITVFIMIFALLGLGRSQESGAWAAWFDTNYRVANPDDSDRKMYGVLQGKVGMLIGLVTTLSLLPGSWLALLYGRTWVFQFQTVFCFILALAVLRFVNDLPEIVEAREKEKEQANYVQTLKDGAKFIVSDKFVTYIILGQILVYSVVTVYGNLILFPFYYIYLFTDVAVASFRTLMYIPDVPLQERSGIWAKKFDPAKWVPRFTFLQVGSTVPLIIMTVLMVVFPQPANPDNLLQLTIPIINLALIEVPAESLIPVMFVFVLFVCGFLLGSIGGILLQRVMLDVIPNKIRNSVYSLIPTLIMIVSIPMIGISGYIITSLGFPPTFIILSVISLIGILLMREAFKYPVNKAEPLTDAEPIGDETEVISESVEME